MGKRKIEKDEKQNIHDWSNDKPLDQIKIGLKSLSRIIRFRITSSFSCTLVTLRISALLNLKVNRKIRYVRWKDIERRV